MTVKQVYQLGKTALEKAGVDSPAFDVLCLFEKVFQEGRGFLVLHGEEEAGKKGEEFLNLIQKRGQGEPLQYLLGEWDFLSLRLFVEKGVLIPRPETELLCETAVLALKENNGTQVLDLCAGTGAVGMGICSLYEKAQAVCVELYDTPFACLSKNILRYPDLKVRAIRADVREEPVFGECVFDGLVSNPPYIARKELPSLQIEVQQEPKEALDGGEDGLDFYRDILKKWLKTVKKGGFCAFEIGEDQGKAVKDLMEETGLVQVRILQDFSALDRVVIGTIK